MVMLPSDDRLHRAIKLALDSGEVGSLEEAIALFEGYRLVVDVGADVARSPSLQAAVLTAVNTGRRCFLGGVEVVGALDRELRIPWNELSTLGAAVVDLGGIPVEAVDPGRPRVTIGDGTLEPSPGNFAIRATFNGWNGGITPLAGGVRLAEEQECTPAGVLVGSLAVAEAFQFVRGDTVDAGTRDVGLSLWRPEPEIDWQTADPGPCAERLPSKLWLIGLGHLGQAYLWTLGFLPYAIPNEVELVLQDFDTLVEANDSTSPLTYGSILGQKKTRAMAVWCERRGFRTTIYERPFGPTFQVSPSEPLLALCGVDNALARAALEDVGFARVIEAGLGRGTHEYLAFQTHTFPSRRSARSKGGGISTETDSTWILAQPAYRDLSEKGMDVCGLTTLAERSVGASFVGTAVSALVIAESIRIALGEHTYAVIDGSLRHLDHRRAVVNAPGAPFNPGSIPAA
jgi:hypothetical protein